MACQHVDDRSIHAFQRRISLRDATDERTDSAVDGSVDARRLRGRGRRHQAVRGP